MPVVASSPRWIERRAVDWSRPRAGSSVPGLPSCASAVRRYGPREGNSGEENPELPYRPIRRWEIWNEANIVTFGRADPKSFARLVRVSGRTVHGVDPGARAILGGLFGRPLQVPPTSPPVLSSPASTASRGVKPFFDGVAPASLCRRRRGDACARSATCAASCASTTTRQTPFYVTELGWGSDSFESRWERGPRGQARELGPGVSMLAGHRRAWRIGGVWWFSWADDEGRLPVLRFGWAAARSSAKRKARLVPVQRLDRRRCRCGVPRASQAATELAGCVRSVG